MTKDNDQTVARVGGQTVMPPERATASESEAIRTPLRMNAYYFGFAPTGVRPIDLVLSAVAHAGKGYHNTEEWNSSDTGDWGPFRGASYVDWIQNAANDAAVDRQRLVDALKAIQSLCAVHSGQFAGVVWRLAEAAIANSEGK